MIPRQLFLSSLSLALVASISSASSLVIRDSIGPDSSLTDGMVGILAKHDGGVFNTPALVVNTTEDGKLTEARFVIFARDQFNQPENDLSDIYGFPMEFHVWSDGIEGGADSFDENPQGFAIPGHIEVDVNTPSSSFITVVPFGHTGPVQQPNMFTTFLVTVGLSSFNIELSGGTEYVMSIFQDNEGNFITGGGLFRISGSRATGFEDVFRTEFPEAPRPGYVNSQYEFGYEQMAGSFTLRPLVPGDYDFDGNVDTFDYDKWRSEFGTTSTMSDGNDDGTVNAVDYVVWRNHLGAMAATSTSAVTVPEPNSVFLSLVVAAIAFCRRRNA